MSQSFFNAFCSPSRRPKQQFFPWSLIVAILAVVPCFSGNVLAQDSIEFLNGSKIQGRVKQIRKDQKELDFETKVGTRTFTRTYPFSKVHAVTMKDRRYELTPKPAAGSSTTRTPDEVAAVIAEAGKNPPDWFEKTKLNYPKSLDLSWPIKPPTKGWQSHKNMGQYIWSVVNENPGRWHSGIKLVHHCVTLHQDDRTLLVRDMNKLGTMYFTLLQDYPRAAFWYEKASPTVSQANGIRLAECYWRLGNSKMALDMMRGKSLAKEGIKLLGDMGEIEAALKVTDAWKRSSQNNQAFLLAADALRNAGRLDEAIEYYTKVADATNFRNKDYEQRMKGRARDSIQAVQLFDKADVSKVANGNYKADSIGYNGRLNVLVNVGDGRINDVKITAHKEKQYYAALTDTPRQIIRLQSVKGVDATSGATITSQAIVNATAKALAKGAK